MQLFQPVEPILTALPASPVDGQIINFLADAANGVVWRLRYRTGASLPWEFIGGSPLFNRNDATFASTNTGYVDDGAGSPLVTLPAFTGTMDLIITWGAQLIPAINDLACMAPKIGTAAITTGVDDLVAAGAATAFINQSYSRMIRRTGATSGAVIKCQYRSGSGGNQSYIRRELFVTPIRLGP